VKPDYIGIGAQKCASSWLHRILDEHPEVFAGVDKEINFFSYYFDRGYEWYENHFHECAGLVAGEFSPSYFCDISVPQRMHAYAPDTQIILVLREPVQRALSNHRHEVRVGHLLGPDFSFEAGLANNPMYLEQGRYATHLKNWLRYFSREQILVVLKEDIDVSPLEIAQQVYEFLGIDSSYMPKGMAERVNRSYANRSGQLAATKDRLYLLSRSPWLRWSWDLASGLGLRKIYRRFNQLESEQVIPAPQQHSLQALHDAFAPEVAELEELLGRSLAAWRA
jgi:hypothetical protein